MDNNFTARNLIRGVLIMAIGFVMILHTLGWVQQGLNLIMVIVSLGAIFYGFITSGLYERYINHSDNKKI